MDRAEEERMGVFCDCAIPRTPGPPILFETTNLEPVELARFERRGAAVYARHCGGCHGPAGKGDGPAAASLLPAPRDLTSHRYSDRGLSRLLWSGVPGSAMPGWHELSAGDLRGLIAYVRSLEAAPGKEPAELPAKELAEAQKLYAKNCASCHGARGGGDGIAAGALAPRPTNFQEVRAARNYAEDMLARGVPGTAMPPWRDRLSAEQRRLLADYVRSLYQAAGAPR
jgi:mono/diheme cytochrome c family protein